MTEALILTYAAVALLSWGFFIAAVKKHPVMNCLAAMFWPVAWLLIFGYLLGSAGGER